MSHWVVDRGHCTLDYVLYDLYSVLERDVEAMNEMLKKEKRGHRYVVGAKGDVVVVAAFEGDNETPVRRIIFKKVRGTFRSSRIEGSSDPGGLASFSVRWKWNKETSNCDLSIQGEQVSLQDISRTALEFAFFENPIR